VERGVNAPDEPLVALRRTVRLYRVALFTLLAAGAAALLWARRAGEPDDFRVIDLNEEIARAARTNSEVTDTVEWFLRTRDATIHMHALAAHQICPLHIHRRSHESTLILEGEADVSHVFGEGAAEASLTHARPGMLVSSPPFCGHAWKNAAAGEALQANLVMESPPFDGNLYLDDADRGRASGPPPEVRDLVAELAEFARSSEPTRVTGLPAQGGTGRLSVLFARGDATVAGSPDGTVALYAVAGSGELEAGRFARAHLAPRVLVLATRQRSLALHAAEPTALLVFRM